MKGRLGHGYRSHPDGPMSVTWQGWVGAGVFASGIFLAATGFAVVGIMFGMAWGALTFVVVSAASGALFVIVARRVDAAHRTIKEAGNARNP